MNAWALLLTSSAMSVSLALQANVLSSDTFYNANFSSNIVIPSAQQQPSNSLSNKTFYWIKVGSKQALVCDVEVYNDCLDALSSTLVAQLPQTEQVRSHLGLKSAMVLPVDHNDTAGVIILSKKLPLSQVLSSVDGMTYQLDLLEQLKLTLWHEIGHLENIALLGTVLPTSLTAYQHEWLADVYLVWRIALEHHDLDLAWQQFHRRNMDLMNDRSNMTHWSSPQLLLLMKQYQVNDIQAYKHYSGFLASILPTLIVLDDTERSEISSLVQRTFDRGTTPALPKYMFWRQQRFIDVISPTLFMLMGEVNAQRWLLEQFSEAENILKEADAE